MARKLLDIGHKLGLAACCGSSADASPESYGLAGDLAMEGTQYQLI